MYTVISIGSGISQRFGEYSGRKGSFGYDCELEKWIE